MCEREEPRERGYRCNELILVAFLSHFYRPSFQDILPLCEQLIEEAAAAEGAHGGTLISKSAPPIILLPDNTKYTSQYVSLSHCVFFFLVFVRLI